MKRLLVTLAHQFWQLKHQFIRFLGGQTVGARALVVRQNEVLLVKHTYGQGWYTIGGGVEAYETTLEAIIRELHEEVGIEVLEVPKILGVYYSHSQRRHDYVVLYLVQHFKLKEKVQCPEIAEKCWFPMDNLPHDISPATKRRIDEYLGQRKISEHW